MSWQNIMRGLFPVWSGVSSVSRNSAADPEITEQDALLLFFGFWLVPPAVLLLLSAICAPAAAKDLWRCSYAVGPGAAAVQVASQFEIRGPALIESNVAASDLDLRARYTILQDNSAIVIAAAANADLDPHPATASAGAIVIMIDKRSGEFQFTGAIFGQATMQRPGHCVQSSN